MTETEVDIFMNKFKEKNRCHLRSRDFLQDSDLFSLLTPPPPPLPAYAGQGEGGKGVHATVEDYQQKRKNTGSEVNCLQVIKKYRLQ